MIKEKTYVKVANGATPLSSPYPMNNVVGKVLEIDEDRVIVQLDSQSLDEIDEQIVDYLIFNEKDYPSLVFSLSDCSKTKRRDTPEEYEHAVDDFWEKDFPMEFDEDPEFDALDMVNNDDMISLMVVVSQALPIYQFRKTYLFEQLRPQAKEWHTKIIDIFSGFLMNRIDLHKEFPEDSTAQNLSIVYHDESIKELMTNIIGQEVAYPMPFFNNFLEVLTQYAEFMELTSLINNKDEVIKSLKKYNMKMLAIAQSPKYWDESKKENMKLMEEDLLELESDSERFFEYLKMEGTSMEEFMENFQDEE
ncbi:MAG TPA: hypothetical protein ENK85_06805 [Saprospiraceae bacterium]|nr:hypothetical protein [Saprospiraceae bacterium]